MNNSLIIHGVWLCVSVGALAVGSKVFPSKNASDDSGVQVVEGQRKQLSAMEKPARRTGALLVDSDVPNDVKQSLLTLSQGGDPTTYVNAFINEGDALEANKMFADLLLNLTPENAREIFDALRKSGSADGNFGRDMGLFLQAWGRLDGEKAIAAVADLGGDGRRRVFASGAAMEGWASTDPEAAKAHLATAENGWEKGMMTQGLVNGITRTDPAAATEYVLQLDAEREAAGENEGNRWRGMAISSQMEVIADAQLRLGTTVATNWAEGLPDGDIKSAAFDQVAESLIASDMDAAREWVQSHAGSDFAQQAVREIAEEFSRTDPEAAITWANGLPEEGQRSALSETFERWTRDDATAASEYLQGMDDSPGRDAAVGSFARELDREDPVLAAQWASSISDTEQRTETLQAVGSSWMRTDPEAARAWLPTSGLSEEAQTQIIEQPARGGWGRGR